MILEAIVMGTSGSLPLPRRHLSSVLLRRGSDEILFDCGEGLQLSLRKASVSWKKINVVCISHSHADHVTGLPGLLMLSSQVGRDIPLTIVCPAAVREFIEATRRSLGMYINFDIEYVILEELDNQSVVYRHTKNEFHIKTFLGKHTRKVWGFSFIEHERPGRFDVEKAVQLNIPRGPHWATLQRGETITIDEKTYYPHQVLGASRSGRKVVYVTDTRPTPDIVQEISGSDLVFIEGMFKQEHLEAAKEKLHLTGVEAAQMVKESGGVTQAALLHFSPRYTLNDIGEIEKEAKNIFESLVCCRERQVFTIPLKD